MEMLPVPVSSPLSLIHILTAVVAANMARGASCVCLMAAKAGAKVLPVDVGIASDMEGTGILNRKIRYGTRNFLKEPAMTREETVKAMETGMEAAGILKEDVYKRQMPGDCRIYCICRPGAG